MIAPPLEAETNRNSEFGLEMMNREDTKAEKPGIPFASSCLLPSCFHSFFHRVLGAFVVNPLRLRSPKAPLLPLLFLLAISGGAFAQEEEEDDEAEQ